MPIHHYRKSLAWHVGILYFLMNLASIAFFTYVIGSHQAEMVVELKRYQAMEMLSGLLGDLSSADSARSVSLVSHATEGSRHQFAFVDAKKRIYSASAGMAPLPEDFAAQALKAEMARDFSGRRFQLQVRPKEERIDFYVPMEEFGQPGKLLYLRLDMREVGTHMMSMGRLVLLAVGVLSLVHLLFALLVLKWIVQPIRALWNATERIAQGDDGLRVSLSRQDEIGGLAEGFNRMLDVIDEDKVKLQLRMDNLQEANTRIAKMAVTDALTGIYNRRHFMEALNERLKEAQELRRPLGLLMMDVDFFKKINDTRGHVTGDAVLARLGLVLQTGFRENDLTARYGGEEFVALLPGADNTTALSIAERCRLAVAAQDFASDGHPDLKISVSVGVAELHSVEEALGHFPSPEEFLRASDEALYYSKEHGRNQATLFRTDLS